MVMTNSNRFKMSQERLDAIKDELYYLETVRSRKRAASATCPKTANTTKQRPSRVSSIPRSQN